MLQEGEPLTVFCRKVALNYQAMKKSSQRKTAPDTQSLEKIARFFRADLRWLVTGERHTTRLSLRVGRKLKEFRKHKGWSPDELAAKLSLNADVLQMYEKGIGQIPLDLLNELAKKLGAAPHEFLLEGEAHPARPPEFKVIQAASAKPAMKLNEEDFVSIPLTASSIAAGHPIIQENAIEDYVLLHVRAVGRRKNLVASRVDGESMEPMLRSGDIVVIDRNDKKIQKNRIYAIFFEEGLTAKYVEKQKDMLVLRPVNPNAQVQIVSLNEHPDPVVGRIIGAWKEL